MHPYSNDTWEGVMRGNWLSLLLLPLLLAAGLTACASNAVQPGIVYTSSAPGGSYGNVPSRSYGTPATAANAPAQGSVYATPGAGDAGRVVSIREVQMQGA